MGGRAWFGLILGGAVLALSAPWAAVAGEREPIKVGYFAPLSGTFSQIGKDMTDGFNLFWEEVGNQVAGRKVEVIVEDTEGVPATAKTKVQRLVEYHRVHTVAGGLLAATGYAVAPYVDQSRIPTVYPVTAPDDITQRKPSQWIVRTAHTSSQLTHPLGEYAYKVLNLRRVATVGMDYAFGWEATGGFQRVFEELGGRVIQRIWTPLNVQDYGPYLVSLKKDVDGVFAVHTGALSARFLRQWKDFGLKGRLALVGIGTLTDEYVFKAIGDEALGVITALHYSAVLDNPANRRFAGSFERKYGRSTALNSMQGYTAARVYYEAIKSINGDVEDRERFLQALRRVEIIDDPRGPIKMDELGNPLQNVYIRKVERVGGNLQNTVVHTYPMVSQFWTYSKGDYLKQPLYDRNNPPCRFCE